MALRYGASLADFVYDLGALADIVDEAGDPTGDQGHAVLVPRPAGDAEDPLITFTVWTEPDEEGVRTQLTDLLDHTGASVSELTVPNDWVDLGQLLEFTVNDGPEGDVWLTTDPENGPYVRAIPFTTELFTRLALVEARGLSELPDVDATAKAIGKFVAVVEGEGGIEIHGYVDAAGIGTVSGVADVPPDGSGNVPTALLLEALGLQSATAAINAVFSGALFMVKQNTGDPGYPAHPAGSTWKGFAGVTNPGPGTTKIWFRPKTGSV